MMRITPIQEKNGIAQLRVEGRVTQQTVEALQSSCAAEFFTHATLLLELSGVQFVDAAGIEAFRHLVQKGAVLIGCTGFLTELLQIADAGEKGGSDAVQTDQGAPDAQLLARLRCGEGEAFEQLVR